ncbi:MAG: hypothetical protein ABJB93_07120 [Gaiellales bacterium]
MGDERDRHKLASDEPDVEAHRFKVNPDEPTDEADDDDDDTPDVEAHRHKL